MAEAVPTPDELSEALVEGTGIVEIAPELERVYLKRCSRSLKQIRELPWRNERHLSQDSRELLSAARKAVLQKKTTLGGIADVH